MRKFYTLLSREIRSYFYSPIAYVVLVFFLFVAGAAMLELIEKNGFTMASAESLTGGIATIYTAQKA